MLCGVELKNNNKKDRTLHCNKAINTPESNDRKRSHFVQPLCCLLKHILQQSGITSMYQRKKPPSNTNKTCIKSVQGNFLMLFDCLSLLNNNDNTIIIFKPVAPDASQENRML